MHALRIPTTRSLALISLPDLAVERETTETASIVTRVAPSFIRVGNFQAVNPPEEVMLFYLGSGNSSGGAKADWEAMRILGEWVSRRVLKLDGFGSGRPWGKELVWECARRNAKMVAGWQAYGYENGVMNTDNISIAGLTIDYGPYAFMDVYDKNWVCNHTDSGGRYAFKVS
jgi:serine/tyrosine/threonine adenylyltransferase